MKTSKTRQLRVLPMLMVLALAFVWASVSLRGQNKQREDKFEYHDLPGYVIGKTDHLYPPPPETIPGVDPERYVYPMRKDSSEMENAEVYLDKFVVWTTDSVTTMSLIGNPDYVKNVERDEEGTWAITVFTGDVRKGKELRDQLRKTPGVISVENYIFYPPAFRRIPTRKIAVYLREASDSVRLLQIADSFNMKARHVPMLYDDGLVWYLKLTKNTFTPIKEIIEFIVHDMNPDFCYVSWDGIWAIPYFTYDPNINLLWGLYNRNNPPIPNMKRYTDLDISRAWNYATGRNIKICVIDLGLDTANTDLKDNLYKCYDAPTNKDTIQKYEFHGTACAGVACAVRNNDIALAGVAPDASLMFARVSPEETSYISFTDQFTNAVSWAVDNGADVISCSLGCNNCDKITNIINHALYNGRKGKGCVFVAASGNDGKNEIITPGNIEGVMCIGAIDSLANVTSFSNYGNEVFAVAPGKNIYLLAQGDIIKVDDGTSYACPAVAGVAALVLEAFPNATAEQVRAIIAKTASIPASVTDTESKQYGKWNQKYGYGLVNAYEAVKQAVRDANTQKSLVQLQYPDISTLE